MTSFTGWTIIVVVSCSFSMILLWPAYSLARRSRFNSRALPWLYAASTAGCSVALWYLIPLVVSRCFSRVVH